MDALPGAKTPMPVAHVENLATWSSTIESSRGWTTDAPRRHCWKDSRHWLAEEAIVGRFGCGALMSSSSSSAMEAQVLESGAVNWVIEDGLLSIGTTAQGISAA